MPDALQHLHELVRADGDLLAAAAAPDGPASGAERRPGPPAQTGARTAERGADYELVLEAIYEGYLLHYGRSRVLEPSDGDLALLAGDRLYALGLARLAQLGDLPAVAELADVISLCALAQANDDPELAAAAWEAGATAIVEGPDDRHGHAKRLAREGDPEAVAALHASARRDPGGDVPPRPEGRGQ
jgi:hypothetical protein